jgi:uncharacterized protein YneF (UPF0154 family)
MEMDFMEYVEGLLIGAFVGFYVAKQIYQKQT